MDEMIFDYMDFVIESFECTDASSDITIHCAYRGRDKVDLTLSNVQNIEDVIEGIQKVAGMRVFGTKRDYKKSSFDFLFKDTKDTLLVIADRVTKRYL